MSRVLKKRLFTVFCFMLIASVCFAQTQNPGSGKDTIWVVLFLVAALLMGIAVALWKYHCFCKEKFKASPLRVGSLFAHGFAILFLAATIFLPMLTSAQSAEDTAQKGSVSVPAILIGAVVYVVIVGLNLKKNMELLGTKHGIIGTILAAFTGILVTAVVILVWFLRQQDAAAEQKRKEQQK